MSLNSSDSTFTLQPVNATDFDAMVDLRIAALRESLERLGRFDPVRARERLAAGFFPEHMRHIEVEEQRIGFITLRPDEGVLKLDHLYILPASQGKGFGGLVLKWAIQQAQSQQGDITLSALKQSDANRFYLRHGFFKIGESEFDIDYRWYLNTKASL